MMSLPTATLKPDQRWRVLWLIPLTVMLLSVMLLFQSWFKQGLEITITFQQGYGLKLGDPLRYRGINIGEINKVLLIGNDLDKIEVTLKLSPESKAIAKSGSLFWIVRPQIGIGKVAGLDTLLGNNYIKVLPGKGVPRQSFIGIEQAPLYQMAASDGLEIILQAKQKGGLFPGALVKYRQFPVGIVLTVALASDASAIQARILINPEFTALIKDNTVFWQTGGVKVEAGISGFSLQMQSFQDLIHGGISLAVPDNTGNKVKSGQRFALAAQAKKSWLSWAPVIPLNAITLNHKPVMSIATLSWQYKQYGLMTKEAVTQGYALAVEEGWLGLSSLLTAPENAIENSVQLVINQDIVNIDTKSTFDIKLISYQHHQTPWIGKKRRVEIPEDIYVIADSNIMIKQISASRLQVSEGQWRVDNQLFFESNWHGAAVFAVSDHALLGFLQTDDDEDMKIVLFKNKGTDNE